MDSLYIGREINMKKITLLDYSKFRKGKKIKNWMGLATSGEGKEIKHQ